jgi:hypothetical protein
MIDLVKKAFADHFPIETELVQLHFVDVEDRGTGSYGVIVRLVQWQREPGGDALQIFDIKEQSIYLPIAVHDLAAVMRLRELAAAMTKVLPGVLTHADIRDAYPHDLVDFGVLKKTAATEAEFTVALERSRRLAPYLTKPA